MACTGASFNLGDCLTLQSGNASTEYTSLGTLINNIVPNIYIAAGLIIFVMVLVGGFSIMSSGSDSHKLEDGKKVISSAIIGLLVLFASYWIIQIIQVVTGVPILNSNL